MSLKKNFFSLFLPLVYFCSLTKDKRLCPFWPLFCFCLFAADVYHSLIIFGFCSFLLTNEPLYWQCRYLSDSRNILLRVIIIIKFIVRSSVNQIAALFESSVYLLIKVKILIMFLEVIYHPIMLELCLFNGLKRINSYSTLQNLTLIFNS